MSQEEFEYLGEQFDYSYELAKQEISRYYSATFKGTSKIIEDNNNFFSRLTNIDEIYILGHSLSDVDLPYFKKLRESVDPNAKWTVSFYSSHQKKTHYDTLQGLGIDESNIDIVRMNDI